MCRDDPNGFKGLCLMFPEHAMTFLVSALKTSGCTPAALGHLSSRSKELRNSSSAGQNWKRFKRHVHSALVPLHGHGCGSCVLAGIAWLWG